MSEEESVRDLWRAANEESPSSESRARALRAALAAAGDDLPISERSTPERFSVVGRASRARLVVGTAAVLALAAVIAVLLTRPPKAGDVTAATRTEIDVAGRARAVLEPSSHVAWSTSDEVVQSAGNVFYRVDRGGPFRVHTPAGDVAVLGTCFRVILREEEPMNVRDLKSGAIGASAALAATVVVYEGKVAVSHASQSIEVVAGETARASAAGVTKAPEGTTQDAIDVAASPDPTIAANKNLVASVSDYRARMERVEIERRALEQQLADARARLEAIDAGAKAPKLEVTDDEWKEFAKNGTVKMRVPCNWKGGWTPSAKQLDALGLAGADGPVIRDASNRVYEQSWAIIKPICEKLGGKDIAERLGLDGCPNFIYAYQKGVDREAAFEAMRRVSEMRAGLRPMPPIDDPSLGPVEKVFLVLTGQQKSIEGDLAQSFGPDEAHRLVTSEAFCGWSATWTGPGPRKPGAFQEKTKFE